MIMAPSFIIKEITKVDKLKIEQLINSLIELSKSICLLNYKISKNSHIQTISSLIQNKSSPIQKDNNSPIQDKDSPIQTNNLISRKQCSACLQLKTLVGACHSARYKSRILGYIGVRAILLACQLQSIILLY
jgi:hypothetical protein